jgi:uncharacterized membrane protein
MAANKSPQTGSRVAEENVAAIKARDRDVQEKRSLFERVSDAVIEAAAGAPSIVLHMLWFTVWISINVGLVAAIDPFDPFPFPFLTMSVSLEAIFLALFVLESQNRLAKLSEQRANLDLQINLLAERESTAALQILSDIARHLKVETSISREQLNDMIKTTDVERLAEEVEVEQ